MQYVFKGMVTYVGQEGKCMQIATAPTVIYQY